MESLEILMKSNKDIHTFMEVCAHLSPGSTVKVKLQNYVYTILLQPLVLIWHP